MSDDNDQMTFQLFHPRGVRATFALTAGKIEPREAFALLDGYLDAGWLVAAPGLEAGEEREEVGWVVRGEHEKDGQTTPFVLLYATNEALRWSFLKVYLNRPEDVAAFEYAAKVKLDSIPLYIGDDKPERGASQKTARFFVKPPKPFGVVFKKNPKHDPNTEEGKIKPARLFVRWVDQRPDEPADQPRKVDATNADAAALALALEKAAEGGEEALIARWKQIPAGPTKDELKQNWAALVRYARECDAKNA